MKKISIVTINYNSEEATKNLLTSLKKIKVANFSWDVVVVDNGSEKVFKTNEKAFIIRSDINTGFTGGCNIGIKEGLGRGADYILLINNDTTVQPDLIKDLQAALESDPTIGVTVPKIYFSKGQEFHKAKYKKEELGRVLWFAGGYIDWKNAISVHTGMDQVDNGQYDEIKKIDFATGCCMLIKREVLERVGFFDKRYFLYYEDADLSQRIIKAGFEIFYIPSAIIYHDNAQSSGGSGSGLHDYFLTRNQMQFGITYAPIKTKIALLRQSLRLLIIGREYQKKGIRDFYLRRFGKGTYFK